MPAAPASIGCQTPALLDKCGGPRGRQKAHDECYVYLPPTVNYCISKEREAVRLASRKAGGLVASRVAEPLFFSLSPASWSHDKLIGPFEPL